MAKLLNSAMMPNLNGTYDIRQLTHQQFVDRVMQADPLESFIGYPQTAELIEQWTGRTVPVNRESCTLEQGDQILIIRLKYRPEVFDKGKLINPEDFEFASVRFNSPSTEENNG